MLSLSIHSFTIVSITQSFVQCLSNLCHLIGQRCGGDSRLQKAAPTLHCVCSGSSMLIKDHFSDVPASCSMSLHPV